MQSLAHEMQVWGTWPAAHTQSKTSPPPFFFNRDAVTKNGAWAATAGPCCSCQQDSPCSCCVDPGANGNEQEGQSKIERGLVNVGSRHGMQRWTGKQSRQNKAAAGEHSRQMFCPAQALEQNSQQLAGLAAKQQPADEVGRPLAVQCRLVEGVRWCWPLGRRARTYLAISLPPITFACHRLYPLP